LGHQLSDLDSLIKQAEMDPDLVDPDDARQLRESVPEILSSVRRLLDGVHAGQLATAPDSDTATSNARTGWL
jgi:hypothetical protein